MTSDADCVFCRIVRGEIPCTKAFEDEQTLAFMDINPANPGHVLVIPKEHAPNVFEISGDALAAATRTMQRVARAVQAAMQPDGLSVLQANGPGAAQSVQHFHWHVLPRVAEDGLPINWPLGPGDPSAIAGAAERIRAQLG